MLPTASSVPLPKRCRYSAARSGPPFVIKRGARVRSLSTSIAQIIRQRDMEADIVGVADAGHQKAAGPLHRWVRGGNIGRVKHRPAVELERRVAELEQLLLLVVVDLARLELPQRRCARVVLAQIARGVHAARQFGPIAAEPPRRVCRETRAVREQHAHVLREPGIHRVAQLHEIGEDDLAGRLHQADIAGSGDRAGALVVADRVGEQDLAALRDLDMPLRDGQPELLVVFDLVGLKEDRRVPVGLVAPAENCAQPGATSNSAATQRGADRDGMRARRSIAGQVCGNLAIRRISLAKATFATNAD